VADDEALDPGDTIDVKVSYGPPRNTEGEFLNVSIGGSTTIREGESPEDARMRVSDFIAGQIEDLVAEIQNT